MERMDYDSVCREMFGGCIFQWLDAQWIRPNLDWLDWKYFPQGFRRISRTWYMEISDAWSNILDLNLTTSPLLFPPLWPSLRGEPKKPFPLALTMTSVSTPYVSFFLLFFYYQGTRNTGDVGCPLGDTIPACRSRMYSWLPAGWMQAMKKKKRNNWTRQKSKNYGTCS